MIHLVSLHNEDWHITDMRLVKKNFMILFLFVRLSQLTCYLSTIKEEITDWAPFFCLSLKKIIGPFNCYCTEVNLDIKIYGILKRTKDTMHHIWSSPFRTSLFWIRLVSYCLHFVTKTHSTLKSEIQTPNVNINAHSVMICHTSINKYSCFRSLHFNFVHSTCQEEKEAQWQFKCQGPVVSPVTTAYHVLRKVECLLVC